MREFPHLCVHQLFETQVKVTPSAVAVTFEGEQLTYHELNKRANRLAYYLRQHGVGPEVLIGICIERSLEMIVGILGVLKAGGAYVPLDPTYPLERLTFILEHSQVPVLVTQQHLSTHFPTSHAKVVCLDTDAAVIGWQNDVDLPSVSAPDNLAYVIYTSGSTGQPKGVQISHSAVVNFLTSMHNQPGLTAEDTLFAVTTLSFDIAGLELFLPLVVGAHVIIANRNVVGDGVALVEALERFQPTVMQATPVTWRILLAAGWQGNPRFKMLCGGEALPLDLARQLLSKAASLWNMYGPTETTIWSSVCKIEPGDATISIGRPIANTQIYLLDTQLQPVPVSAPGELYIGGMGLARGYLKRPDLTAERFIPHPFITESGARLYRTGDLGRYRPDGTIELIGRLDHQVKLRGFRIELGEVEVILTRHALVREAVVVLRENTSGDKRLVAYVIPTAGKPLEGSTLRRYLQELLPEYMAPSNFVMLERLPLTPNSKVDRRALPEPTWSRDELQEYIAPDTHVQRALTGIWCAVLGVSQVGITDNFFTLGGHSLLAMQVVARVRDTLQVELPLRNLFEKPTIVELSNIVESLQRDTPDQQLFHIHPVSRDLRLSLSYSQERVWFIQYLSPENTAYRFHATLRFNGPLDVLALEHSLNEIVRRHEAFRTTFPTRDGMPIQLIHDAYAVALPRLDLRSFPENAREEMAQQMIREEFQKSFDLAQLPLIRWTLLVLSDEEYLLVHVEHHLLHDGWSFNVFLYELQELYNAFSGGKPAPLPELPVQFADFAYWQRQWVQGAEAQVQLAYWKKQLAGSPPLLVLPTDRPRPEIQTFRGAVPRIELPLSLCQALRNLSRQEGVTLFMTLLAVFKVLLYRYSGQSDICVGSGVAARRWRETEGLIGMIINNIVLRTNLSENSSFRQFLQKVRNVTLEGYMHQDIPFDKVVEALQPERNLSYNPLFQVMFSFHDAPLPTLDFSGLTTTLREVLSNGSAKFDINVIIIPRLEQRVGRKVSEEESGITMLLEYNMELFDDSTIQRMLGHYQMLLEGVVAQPETPIALLPLLKQSEREQILVQWNTRDQEYSSDVCIHELIEKQVERTPEATAVVFEDERLSYRELDQRADQIAHHLRSLGVGPEVLVGICVERSLDLVLGLLAVLKAGGAYLPLDPTYPAARLALILQDADVAVLLTQQRLVDSLPHHQASVVCLDTIWQDIAHKEVDRCVSIVNPTNLAYVIYTSGSTGLPKGAAIIHRAVVNFLLSMGLQLGLTPQDTLLAITSLSFDIAVLELLLPLTLGACVRIASQDVVPDGLLLAELLTRPEITVMQATPATWRMLLEAGWMGNQHATLLCGGETLPRELAASLLEKGAGLWNLYGPTETTIWSTSFRVTSAQSVIAIGKPINNTQIYVLDAHLQPVPVGVVGEVYIGGMGLARGYLGRPGLTEERFISHSFTQESSVRLYRTGDLARCLSDGNLQYIGRVDQQVKVRGFRIELGEIEVILGRHPAVQNCVVVVREDIPGDARLIAYIVVKERPAPAISVLRRYLQEQLPGYMVPSTFVVLDELPLTPNRKIDRRALPKPEERRPVLSEGFVAPHNETERNITAIWQDVLRVKDVGVQDNFFDLGGHSLLTIQVHNKLQERLNREISLLDLFKHPTVRRLAEHLNSKEPPTFALQSNTRRIQERRTVMRRQRQLRQQQRTLQAQQEEYDE